MIDEMGGNCTSSIWATTCQGATPSFDFLEKNSYPELKPHFLFNVS